MGILFHTFFSNGVPIIHFRDAFGIYVDNKNYPPQDIIVACTPKVANYLRTLPLHHTQKELTPEEKAQWMEQHSNELSIIHCPLSERSEMLCILLSEELSISESVYFSLHLSVTPDFIGELNR